MTTLSANDIQVGGNHYRSDYQHWDWAVDVQCDPMQYQITKYLRARKKNGLQDMDKIKHFLAKYKELILAGRWYPGSTVAKAMVIALTGHWCQANGLDDLETEVALVIVADPSPDDLDHLQTIVDRMAARYLEAQDGSHPTGAYVNQ